MSFIDVQILLVKFQLFCPVCQLGDSNFNFVLYCQKKIFHWHPMLLESHNPKNDVEDNQ